MTKGLTVVDILVVMAYAENNMVVTDTARALLDDFCSYGERRVEDG